MNRILSRSIEWFRRAAAAFAAATTAASLAASEHEVAAQRGDRSHLSPSYVQSLQCWLVFGGAALPAIKLAERCGDISARGTLVELGMSLLVIVPVGISLVALYRRQSRMDLWEAAARALLFVLVGATTAILLFSCEG